ncbi:MAG: EI24 domain-containing protein [Alphaproteobacteria bacterium]
MVSALSLAFRQIGDPAFRRVFVLSVAAALAVFLVLWALAWWGLAWSGEALSQWMLDTGSGGFWTGILEWLFGAAGIFAVLIASFILFPAIMVLAMSFLLEDVVAAVERRHYPNLPPARAQPIGEMVMGALAFAGITVALNLLFLPVYLLLLFVPPLNLFVFYLLNGYLLGREYFELVAVRRMDTAGAKRLRRSHRGRILLVGVVIAFLLTLPLVNLAMPIVATGFMLHIFEGLRPTGG